MSEVAGVLWEVIAPIFLIAGTGFLLARTLGLQPKGLSRVVFYVFSPCLIFDKLSHTTLSPTDLGKIAIFVLLTMGGSGIMGWLLSRIRNFDQAQTSAFILVCIAGNVGNYGLAANQFAFGPEALEPAVIYYAINTLVVASVGVYLAASGRQSARVALGKVLRVPLAYAGFAGVIVWFAGLRIPAPIERAAGLAGEAAVPVMLVLLGIQLARVRLKDDLGRISLAALTKLGGGAALGVLLASPLGLSGLNRQVAILQAGMPTAVMTTVLATEYDAEPEFAAGVVMASTIGSIATITTLLTLMR